MLFPLNQPGATILSSHPLVTYTQAPFLDPVMVTLQDLTCQAVPGSMPLLSQFSSGLFLSFLLDLSFYLTLRELSCSQTWVAPPAVCAKAPCT